MGTNCNQGINRIGEYLKMKDQDGYFYIDECGNKLRDEEIDEEYNKN